VAVGEGALETLVNTGFWQGRRVFLTGNTGFKGAWLSIWLHRLGAILTGYSLPPCTKPSLFEVANVARFIETKFADVRDLGQLEQALRSAAPEIVFHLAAQSLVGAGYRDPVSTYATNVMGTVHLLEAVRRCPSVRAVVVVTSDKCYANKEWLWGYRESEPMGGYDPYSNSKGCAELVVSAYRSSFFNAEDFETHRVAVASARAGNVIGGGDWAEGRLIPDFIRAVTSGAPLNVRAPGAIRPWQHVLEPIAGYLVLAQRLIEGGPRFAEAWNFGPYDQDARPVEWLVRKLVSLWGEAAQWSPDEIAHPHEASYLKLDSAKARSSLGWLPRWTLNRALEALVEWYQACATGMDMHSVSVEQIVAYERSSE
jgi:CDP-glucose 4,6-dehydratase